MEFIASTAKLLLIPPTSLFLLGLLGWLIRRRRPATGRVLLTVSVVLLVVLSTPWVSHKLYDGLNDYPAIVLDRESRRADAIVILSAATYYASEFSSEVPGAHTIERLRYGALLHRALGLPILVTGGKPGAERTPIADIMAKTLNDDFGITTRWRETAARDTLDNARLSARILKAEGIHEVYLVTHADHMKRSVASFESTGLTVIPAPVGVPRPEYQFRAADLVPSAHGMQGSAEALYEYLARAWYFSYRLGRQN